MGFFFGPPKVDKLKARKDVQGLLKALTFEKDFMVRKDAAGALAEIGASNAIPDLTARLVADDSPGVRDAVVEALDRLGWAPQKDAASARYYRLKGELRKCGECGDDGLRELLPLLLEGNYAVREVWPEFGPQGALMAAAAANMLFQQYRDFASGVSGFDFRSGDDQRKSAVVKAMVDRLKNCARVIGQYRDISTDTYLVNLYDRVNESIYSNPEGGFLDAFCAVDLRGSIVSAVSSSGSEPVLNLHLRVLSRDPARFVRWASIDALANLNAKNPGSVRPAQFRAVLEGALAKETDGVSNRKRKLEALLSGMR